jgi:hypothetical protein
MKGFYNSGSGKMENVPHNRTRYDGLILPGNVKPHELSNNRLASVLIANGVAGASHANGREANLQAYSAFLDRIREAGANEAVERWLSGAR